MKEQEIFTFASCMCGFHKCIISKEEIMFESIYGKLPVSWVE